LRVRVRVCARRQFRRPQHGKAMMSENELDRRFTVYLRERFATYDEAAAALAADPGILFAWLAQLSSEERRDLLAQYSVRKDCGPCTLVRITEPIDCTGYWLMANHVVDAVREDPPVIVLD
jgi:hypothetical protein